MNVNRLFVSLAFFLFSFAVMAQEICDNGIDDDADGLVDLQDPDCDCNGIDILVPSSLFPNPSFEDNTCAPGFGKANCAVGWVNPSEGSPDYFDLCNGQISFLLPSASCPVPDGNKFFGIADIWSNSVNHKEYVGTELTSPMVAGEEYTLSFYVGFVQEPDGNWASPSTNFAIYGNTDGSVIDIPFDGKNCPTSVTIDSFGNPITPWSQIDMTPISNTNGLGWEQVRIDFTALENYGAILIGPECARSNGANYYFLDNLVLSRRTSFNDDFISVRGNGLACNDELVLEVPGNMPNITYQWYKDDIAITGANTPTLDVEPLPAGNGAYVCILSNPFGCSMSSPYIVNESIPTITFDTPTGICPGTAETIGLIGSYSSYTWGNGLGSDPTVTTLSADNFFVTVVDANGCIASGNYNLPAYTDVQYTVSTVEESAVGMMDGSITISHEIGAVNPGVLWEGGSTLNPYPNLSQDVYCVTITADERCPVEDCIDLALEIQPIVITPTIEDVRCFEESNGSINIAIQGGLQPFQINWANHPEWQNQTSLIDLEAGFYDLELTDGEGTIITRRYEVRQPDILFGELESESPTCFNILDGRIFVSNVTGGNGGYEYSWNGGNFSSTDELNAIDGGRYDLVIRDARGCELTLNETIEKPEAISARIELEHPFCIGADDGGIFIEEIFGGTAPFDIYIDDVLSPNNNFDLVGDKNYTIDIIDDNGCEFNQEVFLANQHEFNLALGEDQLIEEFYNARIQTISNLTVNQYHWIFSDGNEDFCLDCPILEFPLTSSLLVVLNAESIEGCTASDSLFLNMTPSKKIYMPNAFSPNNDGINDGFELFNSGEVALVNYFKVYNRFGAKVYDVQNVTEEEAMENWNRIVTERDLESGTYIYQIELLFKDADVRQSQGDISIIR